jgi:excisionase family DNA binding protein
VILDGTVTIEALIGCVIEAKLAPLCAEMARLASLVEALRRAIPPALVPVPEAAKAIGVSEATLRRRIKDGSIPVRRVGRAVRVDLAALRSPHSAEVARLAQAARNAVDPHAATSFE